MMKGVGDGLDVGVGVGVMTPETLRLPLAQPVRNMKPIKMKAKQKTVDSLLVMLVMGPIPYR